MLWSTADSRSAFGHFLLAIMVLLPASLTLKSLYYSVPQIGFGIAVSSTSRKCDLKQATSFASFNILLSLFIALIALSIHYCHDEARQCRDIKIWDAGMWVIFISQVLALICSAFEIKRVSAAQTPTTYHVQNDSQQFPSSVQAVYFPHQPNAHVPAVQYITPQHQASYVPAMYPPTQPAPQLYSANQPPIVSLEDG